MTKTYTIKPGKNLKLRKIGSQYAIVEANEENVNMSDVYSLNPTAAQLWELLENGNSTVEAMTDWLCEHYDVEKETARHDVEKQLAEWQAFGLVI